MSNKKKHCIFTVDVEPDWGQDGDRGMREGIPRLLDLTDRYNVRGTFFVVGEEVKKYPGIIRDISSRHEVGTHGFTHRNLPGVNYKELAYEIVESKTILEEQGIIVNGFRAPYFKEPANLSRLLYKAGYKYGSSGGSVLPSFRNLLSQFKFGKQENKLFLLPPSVLIDRLTPFSLTYQRFFGRIGKKLIIKDPGVELFYMHAHELLDEDILFLKKPIRYLRRKNAGARSLEFIEWLFKRPNIEYISCMDYINRKCR